MTQTPLAMPFKRYPYEIIAMECADYVDLDNADRLARRILDALREEEWGIVGHHEIKETQAA